MNRQPVDRRVVFGSIYGTGETSMWLNYSATSTPVRVYRKLRTQGEADYVLVEDWSWGQQVTWTGLQRGETYDVRFVDQRGATRDFRTPLLYLPDYPGASVVKCWAHTMGPDGRLWAYWTFSGTGNTLQLRSTSDGARSWSSPIQAGACPSRMYCAGGYLYATSKLSGGNPDLRNTIARLDISNPGTGWQQVASLWAFDPTNHPVDVDPWAASLSGPRYVMGAGGTYNTGTWTSSNANNRLYVSTNRGTSWSRVDFVPGGSTYSRRVRTVCYNPVSRLFLVSIGDSIRRTYLVSDDLSDWQLVLSTASVTPPTPAGGGVGCVWLPDGGFLTGSETSSDGHIVRVSSSGDAQRVYSFPLRGPGELYGLVAFDDGEIWASCISSSSLSHDVTIVVSRDWGRTWRVVYRAPGTVHEGGYFAWSYETGRANGDWVYSSLDTEKPCGVWRRLG